MLPLVRSYAVGQYPFVLDAAHVVVFGFGTPSCPASVARLAFIPA